jgi:hypothetical protein
MWKKNKKMFEDETEKKISKKGKKNPSESG